MPARRKDAGVLVDREGQPSPVERAWPETLLSRDDVLDLLPQTLCRSNHPKNRADQRLAVANVLSWLESCPGESWQERWDASGAEDHGKQWWEAPATASAARTGRRLEREYRLFVRGMGVLVVLGAIRPGYEWMYSCRFKSTFIQVRALRDKAFFDEAERIAESRGVREGIRMDALTHLTHIVIHTGKPPRALTPQDLLTYRTAALRRSRNGTHAFPAAWDMLRWTGVFPADTPASRTAARRGQPTLVELVGSYDLRCKPMRDLLIRYLNERSARLDFVSLRSLASNLAGAFWKDLEDHHPGIDSLRLSPEQVAGWKERREAKNKYGVYFAVRALYLDIAHWAVEDPSWVPWVAPCPIRDSDVSGFMKERRGAVARMNQRTRTLAPFVPALAESAERHRERSERLLQAARAATVDTEFSVDGVVYRRIQTKHDSMGGRRRGARRVRAERRDDGQRIDVELVEEQAFWTWAIIETLRHTGVRQEEMLELTHFALSRYTVPDSGEVVPLLQVAPSKTDQERVLLVSPELAHVLARIVARVRGERPSVPLVDRYDQHERMTSPPLPYLFQRGGAAKERLVISPADANKLLRLAVDRAGLVDPQGDPLKYTAHDFRRIFVTEAVSTGLPIHIAAKLLGHHSIDTTQVYNAVYQDDVIRHHRALIARRRALRPSAEYRDPADEEWAEFEQHFTRRKVELGTCGRPYGTSCQHEHACIRCPVLLPDPRQEQRLLTIIINLNDRIAEAHENGWLGEVEGLKVSLEAARRKVEQMRKIRARGTLADLPFPQTREDPASSQNNGPESTRADRRHRL